MKFQPEKLSPELFKEVTPLLQRHWSEIAHFPDIPLEPDFETYFGAEYAGQYKVFTARVNGELVGYAAFFVRSNPHYKSSKQAVQDVLYIAPEFRKQGLGLKLIDYCDQELKALGVQATYHHTKAKHDFGPLLAKLNYELVDLIYVRRLDGKGE